MPAVQPRGAPRADAARPTPAAPQEAFASARQPAPAAQKKGPGALARVLAFSAGALVRVFGGIKTRGEAAVGDFRARPEHSRWRAYALGCYGLVLAGTLAAQLYTSNPLGVYVKVQHVDIPLSTLIFVRNDSRHPWRNARIRLNGIYTHHREQIAPGENLPLDVEKAFAVKDIAGKILRRAPKNLPLQSLALDCDRGHYETELK
jgi:hypothetical protein